MKVIFLPEAERYFKKLKDKQLKRLFKEKIDELLKDPFIGEAKRGDLAGIRCCDIYYRRTNYELAYHIAMVDDSIIVIIMAGTRENFYAALKSYWQHYKKEFL